MKRSIKKFVVTCAAVSAVAAVTSASAMAADYTAENNSVTFSVPTPDADTQMTALVMPKGAEVTGENIYYIDQNIGAVSGNALLKGESLADGTYVVKVGYYVGGEFAISEEEFVVGEIETLREILLGDVANPAGINAIDAQQVLKYSATGEATFASDTDKLIAADVAKPTGINTVDAQQILKYAATGAESQNVGKTAVVNADNNIVEIK